MKSESEAAQSCPTLNDPMHCNLPGSSVHGIVQARVLEWVAIAFSAMQETPVQFLGQEDPLEKGQATTPVFLGFPSGSAGKESVCNVGDLGSIPGLERFPGEGNNYPLQYSGLENHLV